jgi:hypothetical protein
VSFVFFHFAVRSRIRRARWLSVLTPVSPRVAPLEFDVALRRFENPELSVAKTVLEPLINPKPEPFGKTINLSSSTWKFCGTASMLCAFPTYWRYV